MITCRSHRMDRARVLRFVVALGVSAAAGWYGQPFLHGNPIAHLVLALLLALLAGIAVATLLTLWHPPACPGKTWRSTAVLLRNLELRLTRRAWLCILCFASLGLVIVSSLLGEQSAEPVVIWLERFCLGFACLSFLMALGIPHGIRSARMEQMHLQIEREKNRQVPRT